MTAPFRCRYCGGPVNAKADGRPLPCHNLGCPCDIGIDTYAHVYRVPEQDDAPLIPGFSKPHTKDLYSDDVAPTVIMTGQSVGKSSHLIGGIVLPDGTPAPERVKKNEPLVGWYAVEEIGIHNSALDPNIGELEHARRLLWDLYDSGDMDNLHVDGCPDDDTCRCARATALNLVMRRWKPPKMVRADITYNEELP